MMNINIRTVQLRKTENKTTTDLTLHSLRALTFTMTKLETCQEH